MMNCSHYEKGECRSCQWLPIPYIQQLKEKQAHLEQQLSQIDCRMAKWFEPFSSPEQGFPQ